MADTRLRVAFILTCGHVMPGAVGDTEVMCHYCQQSKAISDVHVYEWLTKCLTTPCKFARWHGLGKDLAVRTAKRHAESTVFHRTTVLYVERPESAQLREDMRRRKLFHPREPRK